jgi:hypothetical protein
MDTHPDVQFDNPTLYPYTKKLKMLRNNYEALIEEDKNRRENRKGN